MDNIRKSAKMQAIMKIMEAMKELESERISPMSEEPKGLTIMKVEKEEKPIEAEMEIEPKEESEDSEEMNDSEEEIDPQSTLARLKKKLEGK